MILRRRLGEKIHLARQFGRSLAASWHSDTRAVRLFDGDRLITDVVNNCLPLNHHDTSGAPEKKLARPTLAASWIVAAEQAVAAPAFEAVARVRFRMLLVARPARHIDPPTDASVWLVLNREQTPQDRGSVEPRPEGTRHHSCCLNHDEADSFPPYVKKHTV